MGHILASVSSSRLGLRRGDWSRVIVSTILRFTAYFRSNSSRHIDEPELALLQLRRDRCAIRLRAARKIVKNLKKRVDKANFQIMM